MISPDSRAWIDAGGDAAKLEIYGSIGEVGPFSDGDSRALATIHPHRPDLGAIGDWVGEPTVLHAAEQWLAARGCTRVRGPMEMCRWFAYRATLGPFDEPPFSFEATTPAAPWIDAGYGEIERFVSLIPDRGQLIASGVDRAAGLAARGYSVAALPADADGKLASADLMGSLEIAHLLFSGAFHDVEGFAPIPAPALAQAYARHRDHLDPRVTLLARDPHGEPVGVVLGLPDRAQPERGWYLLLTHAVMPAHRGLGLGSWLIAAAHQCARRAGYAESAHCFVRTRGPDDSRLTRGTVFRRYVLLEKAL